MGLAVYVPHIRHDVEMLRLGGKSCSVLFTFATIFQLQTQTMESLDLTLRILAHILKPGYEIRPHGTQTIQLSCYFQTFEMVIKPSFFLILKIYHGNSHSFSFEVCLEVGPWKGLLLWPSILLFLRERIHTEVTSY